MDITLDCHRWNIWFNKELRKIVKQALSYQKILREENDVQEEKNSHEKILSAFEEKFPGITVVDTTHDGRMVLEEDKFADPVNLLKKLAI